MESENTNYRLVKPKPYPEDPYVAHKREADGGGFEYESLSEHHCAVSELAGKFGSRIGLGYLCATAGSVHDDGKSSLEFQERILRNGPKCDHSTAGAYELLKAGLSLIPYTAVGHHNGLPDGGAKGDLGSSLVGRINEAENHMLPQYVSPESLGISKPDLARAQQEVRAKIDGLPDDSARRCFSLSFLVRMVHSSLVDADYLATEAYVSGSQRTFGYDSIAVLRDRLEAAISRFADPQSEVDRIRNKVSADALAKSKSAPGVFTLTAPTGSGKTIAIERFALNHAAQYGMDRVIVALPFTSVTEQNADVARSDLGAGNVLEHHSNCILPGDGPMRLASENWDAPFIVTTNVQLLESLFASRTSRARKIHNIANSVIVLDEAQVIPASLLEPAVAALSELVRAYGCTVVLSTATQPALDRMFTARGLGVREIMPDPDALAGKLRRVTYRWEGEVVNDRLVELLAGREQVMAILNSRRQVRDVYGALRTSCGQDGTFMLTTSLLPCDREQVIGAVADRLRKGLSCRLVATSLVEAGVDLDFPEVWRALSGLDSIVQAGGRCNRNGRWSAEGSVVHVFDTGPGPDGRPYGMPGEIALRAQVTRILLVEADGDIDSMLADTEGIEQWFGRYYDRLFFMRGATALDAEGVMGCLAHPAPARTHDGESIVSWRFAEAASKFRMIDSDTVDLVIVPDSMRDESEALVRGWCGRGVLRDLSPYTLHIYRSELPSLLAKASAERVPDSDVWVVFGAETELYSPNTGLNLRPVSGIDVF